MPSEVYLYMLHGSAAGRYIATSESENEESGAHLYRWLPQVQR